MIWILHIAGLVLWFGGLVGVSLAPVRREGDEAIDRVRGLLFNCMAWPGFALTLLGGLGLIHQVGMVIFSSGGWFHVKLTLAALLLVLQIMLQLGKLGGRWVAPALVVALFAGLYLVHMRPF